MIYTSDIDMHMKVIKAFMYKLKEHGMLLTIHKVHTFHKEVQYMGLRMSSSEGRPTITPLGSRVKAIATLPIPITARGIKSFIGCVLYLAQFLHHLSKLVKLINNILKSSIVIGLHNEQVCNCNAIHGAESLTLRDFHEGDIVIFLQKVL